jgi:hypothetical protein
MRLSAIRDAAAGVKAAALQAKGQARTDFLTIGAP